MRYSILKHHHAFLFLTALIYFRINPSINCLFSINAICNVFHQHQHRYRQHAFLVYIKKAATNCELASCTSKKPCLKASVIKHLLLLVLKHLVDPNNRYLYLSPLRLLKVSLVVFSVFTLKILLQVGFELQFQLSKLFT
jgi:hypothetical protein